MRDVKRLDKVYQTMLEGHCKLPDWRTGQLLLNFLSWHYNKFRTDGFYIEDDIFIERFNQFIKDLFKE